MVDNPDQTHKQRLLDLAIVVLRRGDALTLDALAKEAGLTKPGIVHHFASKEQLMLAVVDHIVDQWESELRHIMGEEADAVSMLRAYVEHAFTGTFDPSDLALLADIRLRERLRKQWTDRLAAWLGPADGPQRRPEYIAARLLADGAWFNQALGIEAMAADERSDVRRVALQLIDSHEEP